MSRTTFDTSLDVETADPFTASAPSSRVETWPIPSPEPSTRALVVPGINELANPRCLCSCQCIQIVRRTDCIFCDYCIEHHL
ncbi:hypothetical protein FZEAL_3465 [Fusarium zealandicum]|uniref:Uncharacterized protein n=1 Tax=Fusarium zealandicum TaxID=1053134 RepID=A0A8H4UNP9_9HYPO|nr:hypothetical protein FZEAL_3465 [Fusarium zealandicum]